MDYTPQQLAAIREQYAPGSTDAQWVNFLRECSERRMVPGRHLYFRLQSSREKDESGAYVYVKKPLHLTSIDFFRLTAQRTGTYAGQSEPTYIYLDGSNIPSIKSDVPLPNFDNPNVPAIPYAVKLSVYRKDFQQPLTVTARFDAYAQRKSGGDLNQMWSLRGPEQLLKCCEALALRQAFPEELGSLYLSEEIREDEPTAAPAQTAWQATNLAPVATIVPAMDHKPAEGVVALRPNEVAHTPVLVAHTTNTVTGAIAASTNRSDFTMASGSFMTPAIALSGIQTAQPENQDAEPPLFQSTGNPVPMPSVAVPALEPDPIAEFDAAIAAPKPAAATVAERNAVWKEIKKIEGVTNPLFQAYLQRTYNVKTTTGLTKEDWNRILRLLTLAAATNKEAVEKFLKGE